MAFDAATAMAGRFLLRIEDIDRKRCRPAYESATLEDLAWLGLRWEEPVRRQSDHMADYESALERLRDLGVLYRCFRTRREVAEAMTSAPYGLAEPWRGGALSTDEEAGRLARGEPFAWRLSLDRAKERLGAEWGRLRFIDLEAGEIAVRPDSAGDVVLGRKDIGVAYHLASVVDDAFQGVTHIIRGEDLREAVHIQRLLQALLGLPTPVYRHHPLLLRPDGKRLAKRDGAPSLRDLRATGATPLQVWAMAGFDAGPLAGR